MNITTKDLSKIFGIHPHKLDKWTPHLNNALPEYGIDTPLRVAAFLAQVGHESGGFQVVKENLNYSVRGLKATFGRYFKEDGLAEKYARKPGMIASRVYANRIGNGDEASEDGWKYRGRGILQVTGRANYRACTKWMDKEMIPNPDFEEGPELLELPMYAVRSACWYWVSRNLVKKSDNRSCRDITRIVNGGTNGLEHRSKLYQKALKVYNG